MALVTCMKKNIGKQLHVIHCYRGGTVVLTHECTEEEALKCVGARHVENKYRVYDVDEDGKWHFYMQPEKEKFVSENPRAADFT